MADECVECGQPTESPNRIACAREARNPDGSRQWRHVQCHDTKFPTKGKVQPSAKMKSRAVEFKDADHKRRCADPNDPALPFTELPDGHPLRDDDEWIPPGHSENPYKKATREGKVWNGHRPE